MLTNLERAVVGTLNAKLELTYKNVLDVYCTIPGVASGLSDHDPAVYFHHSLDKYADAEDRRDSPYAKYIREVRAQYWGIVIELAERILGAECPFPCPCKCGIWDTGDGIRRQLGVIFDEKPPKTKSKRDRYATGLDDANAKKSKKRSRRPKTKCTKTKNRAQLAGPSTKRTPT